MTQETISISGIGPVEINTELKEIYLVGRLSSDGSFVNVRPVKVNRNKKLAEEAAQRPHLWTKKLDDNHFMFMKEDA